MLSSLPKPIEAAVIGNRSSATTQLSVMSGDAPLKVGEKRQLAVELKSESALGLAMLTLRFDPKVVKVTRVTPGALLPAGNTAGISQSVDATGFYKISVSSFNGAAPLQGAGSLVLIEIEGIGEGDAAISFDQDMVRLLGTDARNLAFELVPVRLTVKQ